MPVHSGRMQLAVSSLDAPRPDCKALRIEGRLWTPLGGLYPAGLESAGCSDTLFSKFLHADLSESSVTSFPQEVCLCERDTGRFSLDCTGHFLQIPFGSGSKAKPLTPHVISCEVAD